MQLLHRLTEVITEITYVVGRLRLRAMMLLSLLVEDEQCEPGPQDVVKKYWGMCFTAELLTCL